MKMGVGEVVGVELEKEGFYLDERGERERERTGCIYVLEAVV